MLSFTHLLLYITEYTTSHSLSHQHVAGWPTACSIPLWALFPLQYNTYNADGLYVSYIRWCRVKIREDFRDDGKSNQGSYDMVYQEGGVVFSPSAAFSNTFQHWKYLLWKEPLMFARWGTVATSVCLLWTTGQYLRLPFIIGHCQPLGRRTWWRVACLLYLIHHHNLLISPLLAKCLAYKTYSTNVYQYFQNQRKKELFKSLCMCTIYPNSNLLNSWQSASMYAPEKQAVSSPSAAQQLTKQIIN